MILPSGGKRITETKKKKREKCLLKTVEVQRAFTVLAYVQSCSPTFP